MVQPTLLTDTSKTLSTLISSIPYSSCTLLATMQILLDYTYLDNRNIIFHLDNAHNATFTHLRERIVELRLNYRPWVTVECTI